MAIRLGIALMIAGEIFWANTAGADAFPCTDLLRKNAGDKKLSLSYWEFKKGIPTRKEVPFDSSRFSRVRSEIVGKDYARLILGGADFETRLAALDLYIEKNMGAPFFLFASEERILRRQRKTLSESAKILLKAEPESGFVNDLVDLFLRANPSRRGILYDYKWSNYIRDRIRASFFSLLLELDLRVSALKGAKSAAAKNIAAVLAINAFALKFSGVPAAGLPSVETMRLARLSTDEFKSILEEHGGFSDDAYEALHERLAGYGKFDYAWKWALLVSNVAVLSYITYTQLFPDMDEAEKKKLVDKQVDEFYNEAADEAKAKLKVLEKSLLQPDLTPEQKENLQHKIEALRSLIQ